MNTSNQSSRTLAALSLMAIGAVALAVQLGTAAPPQHPNFAVILGEGAGWTSCSVQMDDRNPASKGAGIRTPNVERLATIGMRFSDGYAASPRCTPSRAALFTGRSPAVLHMTFVGADGGRGDGGANTKVIAPRASLELPLSETTIAELLKRAGYATAHFGKWHVGREDPSKHGFDESDGPTGNGGPENVADPNPKQAIAMTDHGIDFMERQVKAHRPFYVQMSHYPSQEGKGGGGGRKRGPGNQDEEISTTDQSLGRILDAVDRLGLKGSTYVFFTTDHGSPGHNAPLTGGKGSVWEGGIRVPFIFAGPGIKADACSHVRVTATDMFPTFAELAGVKESLPKAIEGGSFMQVLMGGGTGIVKRPREEFVVHFPHYDKDALGPASALLLGNYKLIRFYETGERMLFDLSKDIAEREDLAKQMPQKVDELDRRLADYLKAVDAQLPTPNPNYDPTKPPSQEQRGKGKKGDRGGKGKGGNRRDNPTEAP